jgi:MarR family transcriptional regulator for hemolysin
MPPVAEPIGLEVARTGRLLNRAFDDALVAVGGSLPMWLIVTALKRADHARQRDIASAIGLEDATLTHHLHRMEQAGLVARYREPTNRRNQLVVLTASGEELFERMRTTVIAFDEQLRRGVTRRELDQVRSLLGRLRANIIGEQ